MCGGQSGGQSSGQYGQPFGQKFNGMRSPMGGDPFMSKPAWQQGGDAFRPKPAWYPPEDTYPSLPRRGPTMSPEDIFPPRPSGAPQTGGEMQVQPFMTKPALWHQGGVDMRGGGMSGVPHPMGQQ